MSTSPNVEHADGRRPLRRALLSVYDKVGLVELARDLAAAGVAIVSTGSTAATIAAAGVPVTTVESVTGFPECLDGRVKTLHPAVHAGLLADTTRPDHVAQLADLGIEPFDLLVSSLYPFSETVASQAGVEDCIEQIDIGGPAMVRGAAKNHAAVAVVTGTGDYPLVREALAGGGFTAAARRQLAATAFRRIADYDVAVATWLSGIDVAERTREVSEPPTWIGVTWQRAAGLRYGENPHQAAAVYTEIGTRPADAGLAAATQLQGKEMSYNNYVDADAALRAAYDFTEPAVAVIKHTNPCGIAVAAPGAPDPIADAHVRANACDPVSAYGGVIAANRPVTAAMAAQILPIFTEVVLAPAFDADALALLAKRKNVRLLVVPDGYPRRSLERRPISGGLLVQEPDRLQATGDDPAGWTLATGTAADEATLADLAFAWQACRAVHSNAILLATGGASVGIGMGQVNRVDSARLAVARAGDRARGSVAASDAFFPFADGLEVLTEVGVRAVVQPGGSIRDPEVIAAAETAGVTLYLTGSRHFRH